MRNIALCFFVISFFCACGEADEPTSVVFQPITDVGELLGKWKLVESSQSIGDGKQHWTSVENGYTYQLNEDGTFSSDRFKACTALKYSLSGSSLVLEFECDGETIEYTENAVMADGNLFLSPVAPIICIEGCSYRFERND
jgi:hypothetical protein